MAFLKVAIWMLSVVIGLVASVLAMIGLRFGTRLGVRWQRRAELAGGIDSDTVRYYQTHVRGAMYERVYERLRANPTPVNAHDRNARLLSDPSRKKRVS